MPTGIQKTSAGCTSSGANFNCPKILNDADSAEEALCVAQTGGKTLQLARHLTAAALNCAVSNGSSDCTGTSAEEAFKACNTACAAGQTTASVGGNVVDCLKAVSCFNKGGGVRFADADVRARDVLDQEDPGVRHGIARMSQRRELRGQCRHL